jgi:hypothetical protein
MPIRFLAAASVALLTLLWASIAYAKVGAVDVSIPDDVVAGEQFEVTFTMEDHDGMLTDDATLAVTAENLSTGERLTFPATHVSDPYHWSAQLVLPGEGTWVMKLVGDQLGFQQDLASVFAEANPGLGISRGQLDAAITDATEPLRKQISSMAGELDTLQEQVTSLSGERYSLQDQVTNLTSERDTLVKRITNVETAQAAQPDESGSGWWLAAVIGALAGAATAGGATLLAVRRGLIRRPAMVPATA